MWPLRWLHHDEGIDSAEVYLLDGPGEAELMSRDEALAIARGRGLYQAPLASSSSRPHSLNQNSE
jgi:hypothetical protein